jgi:Ran GTPase-activating protein (RanGAP) involved in mRNA processing and transport
MLLYQQEVSFLKLSYNRIGARGLARMLKVLKGHASISTMILDHNRIGPSAGKYIGMYLKQCKTLKILNLSHNRMGELDRYLTLYARERVSSAARDIFWGVKYNTNLHMLDLSYNHLGPSLAKVCPPAVCRHPNLMSLNMSGNAIGDERGMIIII